MSRAPSIRRRLLVLLLLPTAAVAALATYSAYRTSLAPLEAAYDQDLVDAALAIASGIEARGGTQPGVALTPDALRILRSDSLDTIYYRVSGGDGRFIAGDAELPVPHQGIGNPTFDDASYRGEPIRTASYRASGAGGAAIVTVAETLHKRRHARAQLLRSSLAVDAAQLATALMVIGLGVRFAIAPLRAAERQIGMRRPRDLDPLTTAGVPIEIRSLLDALNRLLQALRAAEQAERRFLDNAAHQLRTPLAGMLAHLELLGDATPGQAAQLRDVLDGARRLARTTNQLLSLARSDAAARESTAFEIVPLQAVIAAVVSTRLPAADRAGVELGADIEPAHVHGVPWLLEEAAANLVDNAIAATPPGGSVTLRCRSQHGRALLEVMDTGTGIPPAERAQVLDRFYRASNTRGAGSGLGLAIVDEVARMHGAQLAIAGGEAGGTSVRLLFG